MRRENVRWENMRRENVRWETVRRENVRRENVKREVISVRPQDSCPQRGQWQPLGVLPLHQLL